MEPIMLSCRRATELLSQRMDTPLSLWQRIVLRFHLMMCSGCRNFSRQMETLRVMSSRFDDAPSLDDDLESSSGEVKKNPD